MMVRTSKQGVLMFCEECGITEDMPRFYQRYCRFCGSKIVPDGFWDVVCKERMKDWRITDEN